MTNLHKMVSCKENGFIVNPATVQYVIKKPYDDYNLNLQHVEISNTPFYRRFENKRNRKRK